MSVFTSLISTAWQRSMVYRLSIVAYRLGEIAEMLITIVMWTAIYESQTIIGSYTLSQMLTYLLIGNLTSIIARNFLADIVARDIRDGTLTTFLIRPYAYIKFVLIREVGRVLVPSGLSIITTIVVMVAYAHKLILNMEPLTLLTITLMVAIAFVIELFLSLLVGLIAFWTDEVDGIYTTIGRLKKFLSGSYFPISLLPILYVKISFLFPFAYSFFVPAQLYLKKMSLLAGVKGIMIELAWLAILYGLILLVWSRGIRRYEGVGI